MRFLRCASSCRRPMTNGWMNEHPRESADALHEESVVRGRMLLKGPAFLVFGAAILAALSFVVMSLWNALIPDLFAGPHVSFWQAAGLLVLSRILCVGFPRGGHGWRHRHGHWHSGWRDLPPEERARIREGLSRWNEMSREERREFKRGMRHGFYGCGRRTPVDGTSGET